MLFPLEVNYFSNLSDTITDFLQQIRGLYGTFEIIDLVDILFVAIAIYFIIRIIRETRAMQLVAGFVLLAVVYGFVSFMGMSASSFILKNVFSNALLIIVILFGPEIRNILEQVGKGATRNSFRTIIHSGVALDVAEINHAIDATCKACVDMADNKVGALIAFENEMMLGDIISTGVEINAKVSKEMIENIFFPKSPLHDGAMIIRDGKICAAGCILPLSTDADISSSLGTRHRAAIGLSQQTDAIVFVVSEETGAISVAQNGNLTRNISNGDMRDILIKNFIPSGSSSDDKIIAKLVRRIKK